MAVKDRPSKRKRDVGETEGELPKVSDDRDDEQTETGKDSPQARTKGAKNAKSADDVEERDTSSDPPEDAEDEDEDEDSEDAEDDDEENEKAASAKRSAAKSSKEIVAKEAPPEDTKKEGETGKEDASAEGDALAPWLVPAYGLGLLFLLVGERVVPSDDVLRYVFSGIGVLGVLLVTGYRLRLSMGQKSERRSVDRILALLMAGGLLAIAIYFGTTETGKNLLGIATMKADSRARMLGGMTAAWVTILTVTSMPLLFGEIAFAPMRRAALFEARRVRAATIAGATLAFAVVYVSLFTYASDELDQKIDFSYYRTARPGESTIKLAGTLSEPVEVTAFFPDQNEVGEEVKGYLQELSRSAPQLQTKFEDRLLVPALAKELKVTADGVIVLKRGDSQESFAVGAEMKSAQSKLKTLDADFQKTLLKVMRARRSAYFTVGHGELNERTGDAAKEGHTAKNLKRLIESQNYVVKDLGLPQGLAANVPDDARIVLVLGPTQPLLAEEISSLQRYAEKGGRLIVALDPDAKIDLAPVAAAFGLDWKPALLATDDSRHFYPLRRNDSDHVILLTNRFSSHAAVSSLSKISARTAVVFRGAAALDKDPGTTNTVDFAVRALPETFADENGNFLFDKETEKRGSYNMAAAVTKPIGEKDADGKDKEMRVFVFGDADALSDGAVGDTPNGLLAMDVVRWLGGDESFLGAVTSNEDVKVESTKQEQTVWFYATVFGSPFLVLGFGFLVTRRRKTARRSA